MVLVPNAQGDGFQAESDRSAVNGVELADYAAITMRLASGQSRTTVFAAAKLDEQSWQVVEKTWGIRLAKAAQRGDTQLLLEFQKSVVEAQRDSDVPEPSKPLSEYAAMVATIENGIDPVVVCAQAGLNLPAFFELQQAWTRRITNDPNLAKQFRVLVESSQLLLPR